jgi:hypothetical protein
MSENPPGRDEPQTLASVRSELFGLIDAAVSGDVMSDTGRGFLSVMSRSKPHIRQDIPNAFEMYTLLVHYLGTLPLRIVSLERPELPLAAGIAFDPQNGRLVAWIPVATGQMELIAYWVADGIPSNSLKAQPGLLALPFSIETHERVRLLLPEWFGVYYVNSSMDEGFPVLALRSVTLDERFADWVKIATTRMPLFGLPARKPDASSRQTW